MSSAGASWRKWRARVPALSRPVNGAVRSRGQRRVGRGRAQSRRRPCLAAAHGLHPARGDGRGEGRPFTASAAGSAPLFILTPQPDLKSNKCFNQIIFFQGMFLNGLGRNGNVWLSLLKGSSPASRRGRHVPCRGDRHTGLPQRERRGSSRGRHAPRPEKDPRGALRATHRRFFSGRVTESLSPDSRRKLL